MISPVASIDAVSASCNLGGTWSTIWSHLVQGHATHASFDSVFPEYDISVPVSAISGLDRSLHFNGKVDGPYARLTSSVVKSLLHTNNSDPHIVGATNHGETGYILALNRLQTGNLSTTERASLLCHLSGDLLPEALSGLLSHRQSIPHWCYSACSSGLHSLAFACSSLRMNVCEGSWAIAVATDVLSPIAMAGFHSSGALAKSKCAPFDSCSEGLMVGEGSAAVALSRHSSKKKPYSVVILGIGMSCDAYHPTRPDSSGIHLSNAIRNSLAQARLLPNDIHFVVAHGTGTQLNDPVEAKAIAEVFGDYGVLVTSIKGMIGHCMGASGLFNVLTAYQALHDCIIPPCCPSQCTSLPIRLVVNKPHPLQPLSTGIALSSGFGGNNVSIVLGIRRVV